MYDLCRWGKKSIKKNLNLHYPAIQDFIIFSKCFSEIHSRYNQKQVLTVSFPTQTERQGDHSSPQSFIGCSITLQTRRANQFGRAHQLWHYDAETGFISAFNTNLNDKGILVNLFLSII